ncbi:MAG: DUF951 domain-containing protein [Chloroflexota bacterium]|jgi:hypothetical protein
MSTQISLGDIVRLRKKHPCGSYEWQVVRLGVDIGLICQGCGRRIMIPRSTFNKRVKKVVSGTEGDE